MKRLTRQNTKLRDVRHARVRAVISGTATRPRLSVFRSHTGMVAQLIDDSTGKTLCYADSRKIKKEKVGERTTKVSVGYLVGQKLAELAKEKKITQAVFDRGGYRYHGRVAALADGARAGGLEF
ncbi:MAG: 50S ribosomal protein L18 [Candidatus Magasanikbacteria bacterium RIFOXYC2_FULL_42_28]|uniref:Large ribosomal subunit protein uL18 n=1 Tax=Candidatus Magasanikbacteria bacterium RIFOXYC2_FULL_42_28 TaxID=1798704 RepID=A0A1F6NUJ6_9BACT|nr:MAG: 50S ribosomal protein L18 [Candidatus Magasanikbacteria bacterium RIFOXYC2_FULL_42_28]